MPAKHEVKGNVPDLQERVSRTSLKESILHWDAIFKLLQKGMAFFVVFFKAHYAKIVMIIKNSSTTWRIVVP